MKTNGKEKGKIKFQVKSHGQPFFKNSFKQHKGCSKDMFKIFGQLGCGFFLSTIVLRIL
jgi:hypothetical protein